MNNFLNFPVFIFAGIVLIAVVSIFGSRWTRGADTGEVLGTVDCSKTGANGGNVPWISEQASDVYTKMNNVGLKWYQGLITNSDDYQRALDSINTANSMGINFILRICYTGSCGFELSNVNDYIILLNNLADNVSGEFWAIAGHNEPNAAEWREPSEERAFMEAVVNGVNKSNVHLLSPAMDLHAPTQSDPVAMQYNEYLDVLNDSSAFNKLEGIAGNAYEIVPGDIVNKVNGLAPHGQVFLTETGPWMGTNFESFKNSYNQILSNGSVRAALFFKPTGLYDAHDPEHITIGQVHEVVQNCGSHISSTSTIIECAFEDDLQSPCETRGGNENGGHLGMSRGLLLEYLGDDTNPNWEAEWIATAQITDLPAFSYFSTHNPEGQTDADFPSHGVNLNRLSPGCVWDNATGEKLCFDTTKKQSGYGVLTTGEGGNLAKLQYNDGSGVLMSSMGDYSDYTSPFRVPRQFLVDEEGVPSTIDSDDLEATNTSEGNLITNLLKKLVEFFSSLLGLGKYCKNKETPIDGLWKGNVTRGHQTKIGEGRYEYSLDELVRDSDLMDTIDCSCENRVQGMVGVPCKIATSLKHCNPCYKGTEPCDPTIQSCKFDPINQTYYREYKYCENIEYGDCGVEYINKDAVLECLKNTEGILVRHSLPPRGFKLGGGSYILETYWKKIQMLTPERRICHKKNLGIEVDVKGTLYDKKVDCEGGGGFGGCEANSVCLNPQFEYVGVDQHPHHATTFIVSASWYPWWDPGGSKDDKGNSRSPEYGLGSPSDRNPDGNIQGVFNTYSTVDAGVFHPVVLNTPLEANDIVNVTAQAQADAYDPAGTRFCEKTSLYIGITGGNKANDLKDKLWEMGAGNVRWNGGISGVNNKEQWQNMTASFRAGDVGLTGKTNFSIFLRGKNDIAFRTNGMFFDNTCITIQSASGSEFYNTLEVDTTPQGIPGEGSAY
ncbi:hypothetical protein ACFLY9_01475, partial [Patescibacteria group bacterium]